MSSKKLTISEIAKLAEVSKATVSRVLNGYPHIRPEVREKVQKVIEETGFQRNHVARLLATDRSNIIGLVIPSGPKAVFADPYFPVLTEGISRATNTNGLTLALFIFHSDKEGHETIRNIIAAGLLDGVILTADRKDDTLVQQLIDSEIPFVLVGRPENIKDISYIDTDNVEGGYLATEHLIKAGYSSVATIASDENSAGDDRYEGYLQALDAYNIPRDDSLITFGDFTINSGYDAMKKLISRKPRAVFIASDTMALGALRAIYEANLSVPDDIALIGYDDLPPAMQANPPLTTIRQPILHTGQLAVTMLMDRIAAPDKPPQIKILHNELIVRTSCGTGVLPDR